MFPFRSHLSNVRMPTLFPSNSYITGTIMPGPINGPIQRKQARGRKVYFLADVEGVSERFVAYIDSFKT